jgi:transposase
LSGVQGPDFRTISRFGKDNEWLQEIFSQIVRLCRELWVVSIGRIGIEGTQKKIEWIR